MRAIGLVSMILLVVSPTGHQAKPQLLGRDAPGPTPEIFAEHAEGKGSGYTLSADGREFYFMIDEGGRYRILVSRFEDGVWTEASPPSFASDDTDLYPSLSPDGAFLIFSSARPLRPGGVPDGSVHGWIVERDGAGWGRPARLPSNVDRGDGGHYSIASDGTIYFDRRGQGVFRTRRTESGFIAPERLGPSVNDGGADHPFVTPDGNTLFFGSSRPGPFAGQNLWVSFRQAGGEWGSAICLGAEFNGGGPSGWPRVTSDGEILFFTRGASKTVYWVHTSFLNDLRESGRLARHSTDRP